MNKIIGKDSSSDEYESSEYDNVDKTHKLSSDRYYTRWCNKDYLIKRKLDKFLRFLEMKRKVTDFDDYLINSSPNHFINSLD